MNRSEANYFENHENISSNLKLSQYLEFIFLSTSFDGVLFDLLNPIEVVENNMPVSTGFIKSIPMEKILKSTTEVDWLFLYNNLNLIKSSKHKLVIKLMYNEFFVQKNKILNDQEIIDIIHLNTPIKLPSEYNEFEIVSGGLPSYGLKGIYTSVFKLEDSNLILSECSHDIIKDRQRIRLDYSHGIIASAKGDHKLNIFYVDRKSNQRYLNHFIKKILESDTKYNEFLPSNEAVESQSNDIKELHNLLLSKISHKEKFDLIKKFTNKNRFSIVGYCLFEIVHEYFSNFDLDIHTVNQILRSLDSSQITHWSMRAFTLNDNQAIEEIFKQYPTTDIIIFSAFVIQEMCDRMSLFLGDDYINVEDCSFNSLFGEKIYDLECKDKFLSIHDCEILSESDVYIPKEFEHKIYIVILNDKTKIVFTEELTARENIEFIKSQRIENQVYCQQIIYELDLKRAFKEIKDMTAKYSIKILQKNSMGFIAIPLQIDTRGEILLVPNIKEGMVKTIFIRLDHKIDATTKVIEHKQANLRLI